MSDVQFHIEGKTYDLDDFEFGELEWLEDHVGGSLMGNDGENLFSMKAMLGFVYLIRRRDNPDFTLDDARKIKLSTVQTDGEDESAEKPKRPTKPRA